jgi:hypothetical protein
VSATHARPDLGRPDFWKAAKRRTVTWNVGGEGERLAVLMDECHFPGIYSLSSGTRALKVGQSEDIGKRLLLHLTITAKHDPGWHEFTRALRGRRITIHVLRYDGPPHIRRLIESAAMIARSPLWEELKRAGAAREKPRELINPGALERGVVAELGRIT